MNQARTPSPSLRLVHRPYGEGDIYHPGATERVPHEPLAGQPLLLAALTTPAGAARRVWVTWEVNARGGATAAAEPAGAAGDGDLWRVTIPGLAAGDRLAYRLHASGASGETESEPFACDVLGWQSFGNVRSIGLLEGQVRVAVEAGSGILHACLSFPAAGVLRVRLVAGEAGPLPMDRPACAYAVVADEPAQMVIAGPGLQVKIGRAPYRLCVLSASGETLLAEADPGESWLAGQAGPVRLALSYASPADEAFYGFGERFNALDQRGQTLDVAVYEQYKGQGKRTYIPVPFSLSSRGYGLYVATSGYVTYDLAAARPDRWEWSADLEPGAALDYYIFVGAPKEILGAFTSLTGRPELPPEWAFGLWLSGNEWNSQAIVMEQVGLAAAHEIPATVLVIEAWSDEATFYIWNDARYEPRPPDRPFRYADFTFPPEGKWPDPQGMIDDLHSRGIHLLLWQVPVMKKVDGPHAQHDLDEAYMQRQGYAVRTRAGEPYRIRPFWFRGGMVVDFTNPAAERWWLAQRAYLLEEMGIDGFKTDGGEHLWGRDFVFADGSSGIAAINRFPVLYAGAYHRFARDRRPDAITFSRAGFTGCQAYPCHWAGDENSTWAAFRASILAGLNAGASGIPFWGWDLAGFSGEIPSAELYLRATAMACFCPIMQFHSEFQEHRLPSRDRTPWNIQARTGDPDVIPVFRRYAQLRARLVPYLYAQARQASATGVPLMRALPIEYPGDRAVRDYPYQYLLGDSLLVAPVVQEGAASQAVYLPAGSWSDFWTGQQHAGPALIDYATPKDVIPVFVRGNAQVLAG